MIYTKFHKGQGLGNQLWNYIALRHIAEFKSFDFKVVNFKNFKGHGFLTIAETNNLKAKTNDSDFINKFNEKIYYDNEINTFCCDYDPSIKKIKDNTIIKGLFQSEKYSLLSKFKLDDLIKVNGRNLVFNNENICLINIRGGEYKWHKDLILPRSYWLNAIENMKKIKRNLNFRIITDDESYAKKLLPGVKVIEGNIDSDFLNLLNAKYLIISNSSFSYFPINLHNKPIAVIAPSHWSRFDNEYNIWSSPANYYSDWLWQNKSGDLISKAEIKKSLMITREKYSEFNILSNKIKENKKKSIYLPGLIKNIVKFISNFLPLEIYNFIQRINK